MHISEGILTGASFYITTAAGAAAVAWGARDMRRFARTQPERKPLLGMGGAFIFLISLVPIPAFLGTCSHPCGTPLAGILLGPGIGVALSALSLFLQALLFAHGGFATLGANTLALGLAGAGGGWLTFRIGRRFGMPLWAAAGLAGLVGDLLTYVVSGAILGAHMAFVAPQPQYSFAGYLKVILAAYLPVQGPIALGEMVITGMALHAIGRQRPEVLVDLKVLRKTAVVILMAVAVSGVLRAQAYSGMDEKVNEAMAAKAGAEAREPYINLESKGDIWNALLLLGGGAAGFVIGRRWDLLFGKKKDDPPSSCT